MRKKNLKRILKEVVRECLYEVLAEDAARGMVESVLALSQKSPTATPQPVRKNTLKHVIQEQSEDDNIEEQFVKEKLRLEQYRNSLEQEVEFNVGGINVFEGTKPISNATMASPSGQASVGQVEPVQQVSENQLNDLLKGRNYSKFFNGHSKNSHGPIRTSTSEENRLKNLRESLERR